MATTIELEDGILKGVTKPTLEKIMKAGVRTVEGLARQTPKNLAERASIGKDTAEKAIKRASLMISKGFITGKQRHDEMMGRTRLSTGSSVLNELLGGGIESETTTEISGREGSGKTQLCHVLAVIAQQPIEDGGLNGEVAWIDTEDTFRPDRILEICKARELDSDATLLGIHHGRAITSRDQQVLVEELETLCHDKNIKLIIVDSMMAHLRAEYPGRGMLSDRQGLLNDILQKLAKTCQSYGITAVYTNQVMDNPAVMYGNPEKAVGGHIMGHAATTRINIRKGRQNLRIAELKKSPYLPDGEAPFKITEKGIEDVKEEKEDE